MPRRRTLTVEAIKPSTPPRRSSRLHHLKTTQNPSSNNNQLNPISEFSPTVSSSCSRSRSRSSLRKNPEKDVSKISPPKSFKGLVKSNGGSVYVGKSPNGLLRKPRLDSKINGCEGLRKSPRLCNKKMHSFEGSPITPVGIGETKSRCSALLKCSASESKKSAVVNSGGGEVRAVSQFQGKECGCDSLKNVICGLASSCKGQSGRQHKVKANHLKDSKAGNSCVEVNVKNFERMITRSASKSMRQQDDSCRKVVAMRNVANKALFKDTLKEVDEGIGSLKPQKHATHSSAVSKGIEENAKEKSACNTQVHCELTRDVRPLCHIREGENKTQQLIGNKRKRKKAGIQGTDQGWTKEQKASLQRACIASKPSPHFWKRVSKLVPGKSAQECFDKVHSDNLTPLSIRRSSRFKKLNSPSDLSISSCNLFLSPETKSKKIRKSKQKSHIARRTARHLLQKHSMMNHDNESDIFSILEPAVKFLQKDGIESTPEHVLRSPRSSSRPKKYASRLSSASKSPLTSPPVLKKVKNMALHEKYIDQLHKREAKRKVQSSRYVKSVPIQKGVGENPKDIIKAAKDALVSNARDVINKFRDSQANIMGSFSDSEEEGHVDVDEEAGVLQ